MEKSNQHIVNIITNENYASSLFTKDDVADFLHLHLEQYGDPRDHILKAIEYSLSDEEGKGGFVAVLSSEKKILGAVVINKTGMEGYIPENILVYIAVDSSTRGQGIGKKLMKSAMDFASGSIALHVEPDNPAKYLYENLGFTNKYLEMRFQKDK